MVTNLKSKPDEKDIEMLDYSTAINQLNVTSKKELEDTKNQILQANVQLQQLKDRITRETTEIERKKREESLKHGNELTKIKNDIIAKQNQINGEVIQQTKITSDLRLQQDRFNTLHQERIALKDEMVKLQARKLEVEDMFKQAESRKADVLNSQNQSSMALSKAAEESEKNRNENIRLVNLESSLNGREETLRKNIQEFEALREFVEPKIRSIKEQQDNMDNSIKANTEQIARLNQTMQDEKILLQSIQDKKTQLDKEIKDFQSKKSEFERTQILSGK